MGGCQDAKDEELQKILEPYPSSLLLFLRQSHVTQADLELSFT